MIALTLDIAIIALLLLTLGGGLRLHGALKTFRVESDEFRPVIQSLDQAAQRAESTLGGLRRMVEDGCTKLGEETSNTQRLIDELDFITKRADQLADRLDDGISQARILNKKAETPPEASVLQPIPSKVQVSEPRRRPPDLEQRLKQLR
jgi:hypothetical protein